MTGQPEKLTHKSSSIGEIITANHIESSLYNVSVQRNEECRDTTSHSALGVVIGEKDYDEKEVDMFVDFINNEYTGEVLVDNLPGVMRMTDKENKVEYYHGYPVGGVLVQPGNNSVGYAINNHLDFNIYVNGREAENSFVIVGFEMTPRRY